MFASAVLAVFSVTAPFFALVLAGYLAARLHWLPITAIPGLNGFVLYFALPCLLFRFGSTTPFAQLFDPALFVVYLACALIIVGFTVAFLSGGGTTLKDASFCALVASFPNTGFMGVPLLVALFGERAAGPAIVTIMIDLIITSSLCIALAQLGAHHGKEAAKDASAALKRVLSGTLKNPMPWAIITGAVFSAYTLRLPGPADDVVRLLADAASPVALFTIGAVLRRAQLAALDSDKAHPDHGHGGVFAVVGVKLLVHPALVLLVGAGAIQLGLPLDPYALMIITFVAALPSASNVSLLTERYGADTGRVARIILWSTALAFISFSLLAAFSGEVVGAGRPA